LTILAVDDLEATVKILSAGLGRLGHIVAGALSGPEALQIFKENHIDLVICDLAMPEMNGWQVSKALVAFCAEQAVPKPPFIMLTGWDDQQNEHLKISESGVDAVIQKPVDMTKLLGVIQEVLGRGGGDQ
jgi:CheY-like chemotaxis protein